MENISYSSVDSFLHMIKESKVNEIKDMNNYGNLITLHNTTTQTQTHNATLTTQTTQLHAHTTTP